MNNAARINGDPTRVAVGGETTGGHLATIACMIARDYGGHLPIFQLLIYPNASSLRATNLVGLPPALIVAAEFDVLREEREVYAEQRT